MQGVRVVKMRLDEPDFIDQPSTLTPSTLNPPRENAPQKTLESSRLNLLKLPLHLVQVSRCGQIAPIGRNHTIGRIDAHQCYLV